MFSQFKYLIVPCSIILATSSARAADIQWEWKGALDFYYQHSPQAHNSPSPGPQILEGRYFDKYAEQLTLSMAELALKATRQKTQIRMDLAFGEMIDELSGGAAANLEGTRHLTQAFLAYQMTDRLKVSLGKFYSYLGQEVVKAQDNWQYSRSYLFNYGIPFWHEGLAINYVFIPEKLNGALYVLNGWDGRISQQNNNQVSVGINLAYTGVENLTVNYNFLTGAEGSAGGTRQVHELNGTYHLSARWSFGFDGLYGRQSQVNDEEVSWSAVVFYVKAQITPSYILSPRFELYDDADGFSVSGGLVAPGVKQKITAVTLTNSFMVEPGFEVRLELRSDRSNTDQYFKSKDGNATDHQESATLAVLYSI